MSPHYHLSLPIGEEEKASPPPRNQKGFEGILGTGPKNCKEPKCPATPSHLRNLPSKNLAMQLQPETVYPRATQKRKSASQQGQRKLLNNTKGN